MYAPRARMSNFRTAVAHTVAPGIETRDGSNGACCSRSLRPADPRSSVRGWAPGRPVAWTTCSALFVNVGCRSVEPHRIAWRSRSRHRAARDHERGSSDVFIVDAWQSGVLATIPFAELPRGVFSCRWRGPAPVGRAQRRSANGSGRWGWHRRDRLVRRARDGSARCWWPPTRMRASRPFPTGARVVCWPRAMSASNRKGRAPTSPTRSAARWR